MRWVCLHLVRWGHGVSLRWGGCVKVLTVEGVWGNICEVLPRYEGVLNWGYTLFSARTLHGQLVPCGTTCVLDDTSSSASPGKFPCLRRATDAATTALPRRGFVVVEGAPATPALNA
eukprot:7278472-Prorocentrum_lima.AAC.1